MNPPSFDGSSTTEYPENFMEELKKVFDVILVIGIDRVELVVYQLKSVARTWYNKWKKRRNEDAPHPSRVCSEEALLGHFFPRELKEAKKVEEENKMDGEEYINKNAKTMNECATESGSNWPQFQKPKGHAPSATSALAARDKVEHHGLNSQARPAYSHSNKPPACAKCGRNHSGICCESSSGCFK
ncbi:uncharacterized protein [Solanum lycopersicum]|uniref:uncharacterized protein n=1 Tax=Solanum lycopersicum TaxID=4081 RepID=UPI00374A5E4B